MSHYVIVCDISFTELTRTKIPYSKNVTVYNNCFL
jgi:hypothetical protein